MIDTLYLGKDAGRAHSGDAFRRPFSHASSITMAVFEVVTLVGLGCLAGLLIGAVGIGGVILVPALVYFVGVPIHAAIAGAMMSYLLTGLVGTLVYARAKSIQWNMVGWLWAGAMPAALGGALAANVASPALLEILIGLLTLSSGLQALFSSVDLKMSDAPRSKGLTRSMPLAN